jgi:tRNA(fMet)-specific endonuclease VapC
MNGYLLDTDICVFFLQKKFNLIDKIDAVGQENCYVSEITLAELLYGAENSNSVKRHLAEVEEFENAFRIIPLHTVLRRYAKEKVRLRKAGTPIAEFDLLIGATALSHDLVMVTGNVKHFKKLKDLQIENWTQPAFNEFL